jgi:hypothetical protein
MAAGEGFKEWQTGDVLTANDVNGYLNQGIWVFDDAADRTAQVTSPQEGNFAYLRDDNKLYYYTGSAWAEADTSGIQPSEFAAKGDLLAGTGASTFDNLGVGANGTVLTADSAETTGLKWVAPAAGGGGLVFIAGSTFTTQSSVIFNNCFSATYQNYLIVGELTGAATSLTLRLRVGGSNATASNYTYQSFTSSGTSNTSARSTTEPWFFGPTIASGDISSFTYQLFRPFETKLTGIEQRTQSRTNTNNNSINLISGAHTLTNSYDGFEFADSNSPALTFSGSIRVYGFQNS